MKNYRVKGDLILEDGSIFNGYVFGCKKPVSGEVVFNTGMVGYPETLTDPSYNGQILVMTYPLVGNYGIPMNNNINNINTNFESSKIQVQGLLVSEHSFHYNHRSAVKSLDEWLKEYNVPGLYGVDTRALTKILREKGTMLGKIYLDKDKLEFYNPDKHNLIPLVSIKHPIRYERGKKRVVVIDCGCKNSIIRNLLDREITVIRVPWNYNFFKENFDGVVISNGPGNPKMCPDTIAPIFGICLGHQILSLAAGADTYKLKYGHRSQNQPSLEIGSNRCYITSQNHGYAVDVNTLPNDWEPWFINANDETNEGILHKFRPFSGVQFHPESAPGPYDTSHLFDNFIENL
jgi:carbamoyl-phosphate synthase small subunit